MMLWFSFFTTTQAMLLTAAGIAFLSSLYFQIKQKEYFAVGFLIVTALCVYSFAALLDPFLNLWDERFHALVAKNLMHHPLMPTLYDDPVVNMAYDRWDRYVIWLHKQPLFLWQITLSYKLFGVSEFSLRIPDIILGTTFIVVAYRSGKLLLNTKVGYFAAVLSLSTLYLIELAAGRQEVDHNDFSFFVYVSLSLWALIEYQYSKKYHWIIFIGLFSGMAILCKWLVGLLVYFVWTILIFYQKQFCWKEFRKILIALIVTGIIVLPWQILTFIWYPAEASSAFEFNASHFWIPIDGQRGDFWYHFDKFDFIYGSLASFLILPAFYVVHQKAKNKALVVSFIWTVVAGYLFFSCAATKMASFPLVTAMIIFIAFGALLDVAWQYLCKRINSSMLRNLLFAAMAIALVVLKFNIGKIQEKHSSLTPGNSYSQMLLHNKDMFLSINLPENAVLFNIKGRHYIEAMFYTGRPAYNFIPTFEQFQELKSKGRRIAIINPGNSLIPDYLQNDPATIVINKTILGYE